MRRTRIAEQLKSTRETMSKIDKDIAKNAKSRAKEIEQMVVGWIARWGFTTDKCLQMLYPSRPRLGYDLSKRGLLRKIEPGRGVVCKLDDNNGWCYGLSENARILVENEMVHLVENIEQLPKNPHWTSLQHLLDLQKIFIQLAIKQDPRYDPKDPFRVMELVCGYFDGLDYKTEIETKRFEEELKKRQGEGYNKPNLAPDLIIFDEQSHKYNWIEYERSPKSDIPLMYWIQQLTARWIITTNQKDPESTSHIGKDVDRDLEVQKFIIIVPTTYQKERYLRFFLRKNAKPVTRNKKTRRYEIPKQQPGWSPYDVFSIGNLEVLTLQEVIEAS
jgi:hypothetical protein